MEDVKIGDVVHGFGWRRERPTTLKVTEINYMNIDSGMLAGVVGRVINRHGRLTHVEESISARDLLHTPEGADRPHTNIPSIVRKPGGWEILHGFEIKSEAEPLAYRIRNLEIGEDLEIKKGSHTINTCRVTASLIGDETENRYKVNKTPTGCKITRIY